MFWHIRGILYNKYVCWSGMMFEKNKSLLWRYFILIIGLLSIFLIWLNPSVYLKGKEKLELDVYTNYKEPGYSASFLLKDLTSKVIVTSNIDNQKLGTYEVRYDLSYGAYHTKKTRYVNVIDRKKPIISLKGESSVSVCPSKSYVEEGYKAEDNYDGDITEKVKLEVNKNEIKYTVKDNSNNEASITRKIIYEDKEAPTLTINGNNIINIYLGTTYEEPGYTATDNCEGDITDNVTISGSVDTNTVGEYTLTYSVSDKNKNMSTITRKVKVIKKDTPIGSGDGKVIYLTFDDGPSASITPYILQILKEENVKATFFVINHDDSLNYLIKQESDDGHTVALHSYTHDYSYIYSSVDNYFEDLTAIENKVKSITGKKSTVIRFPGGASNTVSRKYQSGIMTTLSKEVVNKGYNYFDWNVDSDDAGGARNKEAVYQNVVNNLYYQNNVILMHDFENNYKTLEALRDIIQYGKQNGYVFKAITDNTPPSRHAVNN